MVAMAYVMGAMVVCGWVSVLLVGLSLVPPPQDVRGQGNDDGSCGCECAGLVSNVPINFGRTNSLEFTSHQFGYIISRDSAIW
jgi:hypothetical protein